MGLLGGRPRRTSGAYAVVTGAGSGIGRAFALELARRGGRVVCADIDLARAKETVVLVEAAGGEATAVACDVSLEIQVWELADAAEEWLGRPPTLVINNAGVGAGGRRVGETALADWHSTLDVNLWGVVHGCHVFVPRLRAGGGGIINVASAAGFAAAPRMSAYNVSKAAVMSLSETLAAELSGSGVAVTVLCPTFVRTNIIDNELIEPGPARLARSLMRLTGRSPDAVARATLDAHDRGRLYVLPQIDARATWRLKRLLPVPYARAAGLLGRLAPSPEASPVASDRQGARP
jgi:NAD(P)-dependent dehydrogenase (short-subunit alcohol dehydrogenase family)